MKLLLCSLLVCLVAAQASIHSVETEETHLSGQHLLHAINEGKAWFPTEIQFEKWIGFEMPKIAGSEFFTYLRENVFRKVTDWLHNLIPHHTPSNLKNDASDYPYFRWVPAYIDNVIPDGNSVSWSAPCFKTSSAKVITNTDGTYTLTLSVSNPASLFCSDFYFIATVHGLKFQKLFFHGEHTVQWVLPAKTTDAQKWDLTHKGIRIFRFQDDVLPTLKELLDTVLLFVPELTKSVPQFAATMNVDFMNKYSHFKLNKRTGGAVDIDESLIQSGDFFGIVRLDGLDPMLAWAMGSTTGHTTIALRVNGTLNVCESTTKDSYWPTNGVQCTEYKKWRQQARDAGYNTIWAPLAPEYRAKFNATAAYEFFQTVEGFDYGYHTLLFGWIDTLKDNYPCLAPDYKVCLTWSHVEVLAGIVDSIAPSIADLIFLGAFNNRVGTQNLRAAELYYAAYQKGMDLPSMPTMVEHDEYVYNTLRNGQPAVGPSMVCCSFVCRMWKAGGIFSEINDEITCNEMTNWDDYSLTILDDTFYNNPSTRPEACQKADPNSKFCIIDGDYELFLNDFASKKMYSHMAEKCPSLAPDYKKPADC